MGWASGSSLGIDIYDEIRQYIPDDKRKEVARFIYDQVTDMDADDWDLTSNLEIDSGETAEWIKENPEEVEGYISDEVLAKVKARENI